MNNTNTNTTNGTAKENNETENFKMDVTESKGIEYPEIEEGVYSAIVEKITMKSNVKGENGFFDMLIWYFVVDDEGTMKFIQGTSSAKMTTMSKAFSWVSAITGKIPEINSSLSLSDLKTMKCQVVIKNEKVTNDFNGQKTEMIKPTVKEVLKAKKGSK